MERHLKFKMGQQKLFIESVISKSRLNINSLALMSSISPRNFRDWKNEKLCITKSAVKIMSNQFNIAIPETIGILENRWVKYKSEKGRIGGLAFKKIYGNPATQEGRIKGGKKTLSILREKGVIPPTTKFNHPKYSNELAEFVGILLGDGGITSAQIQITLNSVADKKYVTFVEELCAKLFKIKPKTFKKKDCNAIVVYYNGVDLIEFLKSIGLKPGNKVQLQVDVPKWIQTNEDYSTCCLRGLIDTDGCIGMHSYLVNGKKYTYKNLIFANRSIPLINFVNKHLNTLELGAKIANKLETKYVWLYNHKQTQKYLEIVSTHNPRILLQGG